MSIALAAWLKPLVPWLERQDVSEICINKPGMVWLEERGVFTSHQDSELTETKLMQLAQLIAESCNKDLSETRPLLSATLPSGERCQFVLPPACERGQIVCAIRKPSALRLSLDDWEKRGAFARAGNLIDSKARLEKAMHECLEKRQWKKLVALAVKARYNIIISGGTSTAKTTFLNSCLKEIPCSERIVTIEGVREVVLPQPNCVHLLANEDEDNLTAPDMLDLLKVSLRLRPDRIFVSELRGREAYPFLRACISGHPGSLTTLHADSIEHALMQLRFMLSEAPELQNATEEKLTRIIESSVNMIIQMARTEDGMRVVDDIALMTGGTHVYS